ncbi:MAG: hypothetical protein H0W61_06545 [Bacteroidetes bacterium]|nr:hypothetical protein [Bacteroidota bacterium]
MKIFTEKWHGIVDYTLGTLLLVSPWLFGFAGLDVVQDVPMVMGVILIAYTLFSNLNFGLVKIFSVEMHKAADCTFGVFLAASPWLYDFSEYIYAPHLIFGLLQIANSGGLNEKVNSQRVEKSSLSLR